MQITEIKVLGDRGIEYTVTAKDQTHVTCSCPDNVYRGGVCKHITFIIDTLQLAPALSR